MLPPTDLPATQLPDGTWCTHQGQTSTHCTRCWTNLYELRERRTDSVAERPLGGTRPRRGERSVSAPRIELLATQLPDGTWCDHAGETAPYCTRCGTDLYQLRQGQTDPVGKGDGGDQATRDSERTTSAPGPMSIVILVVVAATLFTPFLGGGDLSVRVLLAIAPGLLIMERLVRADRFPEPASLLLLAFAGGAASCLVAGPLEVVVDRLTKRLVDGSSLAWLASDFSRAFAGAAVCEETVKYVLVLLCMRRHAFDEPFDGMVYGVTVSLGFAALENIFYVAGQGDADAALKVAFLRAVTAVPAHAATGAIMGFFLGLSHRRRSGRSVLLVAAWAAPVALHGAYDFILFVNPRFGGALGRFWLMVFLYELNLAWRMLRKLRAVQHGASAEELVRQVRRRMGLSAGDAQDTSDQSQG